MGIFSGLVSEVVNIWRLERCR